MSLIPESKSKYRFVIDFVILGFAFYAYSKSGQPYKSVSTFDRVMLDSVSPIQKSVHGIYDAFSNFFNHYFLNVNASKENKMLKSSIDELNFKIFSNDEIKKENERLRKLLNFKEQTSFKSVSARVIAWDSSSDYRTIRIDKGLKSGIRLQSPVISHQGVVGYVYRMSNNFADVLTILDPNNRVDAMVSRTRSHGIVEGYSTETCLMKYLKITDPIVLNDEVLTSGLGYIYPKGLMVGKVAEIERESYGITQNVTITPSVDFNALEEVIVLTSPAQKEQSEELEALNQLSQ